MQRDKVHLIVCRWMRRVLFERQWSANEWATQAGLHSSAITRVLSPPMGEEPMIPTMMTIAQLAAVAGSQPDLLKGARRPVSYVPVDDVVEVASTKAKRKVG